jgi:predicted nucleic acid-binding protein
MAEQEPSIAVDPGSDIANAIARSRSAATAIVFRVDGQTDFDILIAAAATEHGLTLLTFNRRHVQRIPDLKLFEPT